MKDAISQDGRHRRNGRTHPRRMRKAATAHPAAGQRRPVHPRGRRLGANALPAVLCRVRHYRSGDAGRVSSHGRWPAEARQGRAGEKDRGKSGTSDQHGRHMRARSGGRAGALPSRSHSNAAQALGTARVGTLSADCVERGAAAARDTASAAAGHPDAIASDRSQKSGDAGHDRRTVRRGTRDPEHGDLRPVDPARFASDGADDGISRMPSVDFANSSTCSRSTPTSSRRSFRVRNIYSFGTCVRAAGPRHVRPGGAAPVADAACADDGCRSGRGRKDCSPFHRPRHRTEKCTNAESVANTGGFAEWSASLGDTHRKRSRPDRRARRLHSTRRPRVCTRRRASP